MSISTVLSAWQERLQRLPNWVRKTGHGVFLGVVLAMLAWRTYTLGWETVVRSLPASPLFYILFLAMYLSLPATEYVVYRSLIGLPRWLLVRMLVVKRVLNKEVFGYAGDLYYSVTSARALDIDFQKTGVIVKDAAIVSAVASTAWTISFLFGYAGVFRFTHGSGWANGLVVAGAAVGVVATLVVAGWMSRSRARIYHIDPSDRIRIFGLMYVRLLLVTGLQVVQWAVALPDVSFVTWMLYAGSQLLVSRIPLIPGKDLVFAFVGIQMGLALELPAEGIAGMLLVNSAMDRLLNGASYVAFARNLRKR